MFIPLASVLALASIPSISAQAVVQQVGGFCSADLSGYYQTVCAPGLVCVNGICASSTSPKTAVPSTTTPAVPNPNSQPSTSASTTTVAPTSITMAPTTTTMAPTIIILTQGAPCSANVTAPGVAKCATGFNCIAVNAVFSCQPATTTTAANTTQPSLPQGSSCNPSASGPNSVTCAAGLRCGPAPTNATMFTCQSFIPTPVQPIPQGGRCNVTTGAANPSFAQCGQGLTCLAVAGQAGSFTCQIPAPPTQPTTPPSTGGNGKQCGGFAGLPCPMGLICTFAPTPVPIFDSFGVCAAPSYQVSGQGGPCSATNAANAPICASGLVCASGTCQIQSNTGGAVSLTGGPCGGPAKPAPTCAQGLNCVPSGNSPLTQTAGTCQAASGTVPVVKSNVGEFCGGNGPVQPQCVQGLTCVQNQYSLGGVCRLVTGQSGQIVLYQNGQILYGNRVILQQSDIAQLAARVSIQATTCGRIIEEISRIQAATIDFRVATRLIAARFGVSSLTLVNIANGCAGQFSTVPNVFQVLSTISTYGSYFGQTVVKIPIAANVYGGVQITATYLGFSSQTVYFKRVIGCVGQWGFSRVDASTNATQEVVLNVINSIINGQDIRSSSTEDIKNEVEAISTANDVAPAFVVNVASNIHDSMVESNETTNTTALALFSAVAGADLNATLALDAQGEDSSLETASSALAAGISIVLSMIAFYAL
ncbi:hypothetical protein HDU78_000253 [Chytriomyces hyalinus]|nr:hypothetical protein HDU78_000253 [Chytriomyces hyalinus]